MPYNKVLVRHARTTSTAAATIRSPYIAACNRPYLHERSNSGEVVIAAGEEGGKEAENTDEQKDRPINPAPAIILTT
jgi:hypothetical protein